MPVSEYQIQEVNRRINSLEGIVKNLMERLDEITETLDENVFLVRELTSSVDKGLGVKGILNDKEKAQPVTNCIICGTQIHAGTYPPICSKDCENELDLETSFNRMAKSMSKNSS